MPCWSDGVHATHMDYSKQLGTHAAALSDGSALVYTYQHSASTTVWVLWALYGWNEVMVLIVGASQGSLVPGIGATCVTICTRFMLLAVGCQRYGQRNYFRVLTRRGLNRLTTCFSGEVRVYSFDSTNLSLAPSHVCAPCMLCWPL